MDVKLPKEVLLELDLLIEKLSGGPPETRMEAMSRLVAFERTGQVPLEALLEMAEDSNPSMAMYAIMALGRNRSPKAAQKLIALIKKHRSGNRIMLETVIDALGETGQRSATNALLELIGVKRGWWAGLKGAVGKKQRQDTPEQARERELLTLPVARALEHLGDPKAAVALGPYLEHEDPLVRWHVIQALQKTGVTDFNDRLQTLAGEDESDLVREAATLALSALSPLPQHLNN
jgi:HEAT repeat protein